MLLGTTKILEKKVVSIEPVAAFTHLSPGIKVSAMFPPLPYMLSSSNTGNFCVAVTLMLVALV